MKTSVTLRAAKLYMEAHGWTQGSLGILGGPCCTRGAVFRCRCSFEDDARASDYMRRVIGRDSITAWNDADDRTVEEVFAAFDRAIELAEAAEAKGIAT